MTHPTRFPSWRLAAAALLLASGASVANGQDVQGAPAPAAEAPVTSPFVLSGRADLEQATQYILERIAEHRTRLERMDKTVAFFRQAGDAEKMRLVEHLRERELNAFHQTLEEYRRLLGDKDFNRVISAVRERMSAGGLPEPRSADEGTPRNGPGANPRNEFRRLAVERQRATQRAKIAARMKEATSSELRRRAQAARSVPKSVPSTFSPRGGVGRGVGSVLPGMGGVGGRNGQPFNPYTRQRGRP